MPILLLLFIGVPIAEIAVFIQVGDVIGLWPTLATVVLTALLGSALLRHQGLSTLARAQAEMQHDRFPAGALLDGACLIFAGALLLTPGFLTDAVGFALFIPGLRQSIGKFVLSHVKIRMATHQAQRGQASSGSYRAGPNQAGPNQAGPNRGQNDQTIYEAEYEDVTDQPPQPPHAPTPSIRPPDNGSNNADNGSSDKDKTL